MDDASDDAYLGGSRYKINTYGCIFTAYVKIANAINFLNEGKQYSLEEANAIVTEAGNIYDSVGGLGSAQQGADLISLLTGEDIGYYSFEGSEQYLKGVLTTMDYV
ncbi:MAG: hypothetical protein PF447_06585, partial [Spirochaetaceae bacterium]|nr:hypothetical protein [Spirochaetaceae bacterium]